VRYHCALEVTLKKELLDPQGKAVEASLPALGWTNVSNVRVGKHIEMDVEAADEASAVAQVHDMAERVLSNAVIERFVIRDVTTNGTPTFEDHR
jgi:phosphoribosylformylglycinamidine synthase subunit PurS